MATSHYIAFVFGVLFMLAGLVKVLPLDKDQVGHGLPEMYDGFEQFIKVLPLRDFLGIKTATMYISLVGAAELILGALLAFGRPGYRMFAAVPLLGIMIGAIYTLLMVGEPPSHTIPATVFGSALIYILLNQRGLDVGNISIKTKSS